MNIKDKITKKLLERRFCLDEGVGSAALGVATLAGAAGVAVGAAKLYDRYLSTHAAACRGVSGIDKSICIIKSKIVAGTHTIQYLQSSVATCQGNANCIQKTQHSIALWKTRVANFYSRLQILEAKKKRK
jgi:hypothetical protein